VPLSNSKSRSVLTEKAGQLFCDPALIELDHEPELFELIFNRLGDLLHSATSISMSLCGASQVKIESKSTVKSAGSSSLGGLDAGRIVKILASQ
jgi:hypothetical protein